MIKNIAASLLATALCLTASAAIAGPDWIAIEKARLAKAQEKQAQLAGKACMTVAQNTATSK